MNLAPVLLALLVLAAACEGFPDRAADSAQLQAEWSGSTGGRIAGDATAEWCPARRLLEIRAIEGDTGIALALYPSDTLAAGKYRVMDPAKAQASPPAAGVALRWFGQNAVEGFQGDSGWVELERAPSGRLSGTMEARVRSVNDAKRLTLTGRFQDVKIAAESRGCLPLVDPDEEDAASADTGIH